MPKLPTRMGRSPKTEIAAALLALVMCGCGGWDDSVVRVTTREYEHPQWGSVIHVANDEIEIIIAPERGGRLMHYSRLGESNLLWTARDIGTGLGDVWGWKNWGGEKTWLWPQGNWTTGGWPPPHDVEQAAYTHINDMPRNLDHNRNMDFEFKSPNGMIRRGFWFPNKGTRVHVRANILDHEIPFSAWSVTQIPARGKVELERTAPHRALLGMPDEEFSLVMPGENTIDLTPQSGGVKGMFDADGFRVSTAQGTLVVRQSFIDSRLPYDGIYRAQVYISPDVEGDAYVELEFAAPLPTEPGFSSQWVTLSLE